MNFFLNKNIHRFAKIFWMCLTIFSVVGVISSKDVQNSYAFIMYVYLILMWTGNRIITEGIEAIFSKKEKQE
jgi:hypothetical protein